MIIKDPFDIQTEDTRVSSVVNRIQFPGYKFILNYVPEGYHVHVQYHENDVMTGVNEEQNGRKWYFPYEQSEGQIIQTCFKAILTSLEHRAREHFTYKGKAILQPHMKVDDLLKIAPEVNQTAQEEIKF